MYWWMPWDKIYRKSFIDKNHIKFPPDTLAEDIIFVIQFFLNNEKMIYLNNYYGYNWNIINEDDDASLSHVYSENTFLKFKKGYYILYNLIKEHISQDSFEILFEQCLRSLFSTFCLVSNCDKNRKIELLEELYDFVVSLNLINITFTVKWASYFNFLLLRRRYNLLIIQANIMGGVWRKINK